MDIAARASTSHSSIPRDENVVLEVVCSSSIPLSSAMDTLDLLKKKLFELISLFRKLCQQSDQSKSWFWFEIRERSLASAIFETPCRSRQLPASHVVDAFSDADHARPNRDDNPCDD